MGSSSRLRSKGNHYRWTRTSRRASLYTDLENIDISSIKKHNWVRVRKNCSKIERKRDKGETFGDISFFEVDDIDLLVHPNLLQSEARKEFRIRVRVRVWRKGKEREGRPWARCLAGRRGRSSWWDPCRRRRRDGASSAPREPPISRSSTIRPSLRTLLRSFFLNGERRGLKQVRASYDASFVVYR